MNAHPLPSAVIKVIVPLFDIVNNVRTLTGSFLLLAEDGFTKGIKMPKIISLVEAKSGHDNHLFNNIKQKTNPRFFI